MPVANVDINYTQTTSRSIEGGSTSWGRLRRLDFVRTVTCAQKVSVHVGVKKSKGFFLIQSETVRCFRVSYVSYWRRVGPSETLMCSQVTALNLSP